MTQSIDDFFGKAMTGGGGGGTPAFDFGDGRTTEGIGRSVKGEIVDIYKGKVTDIDTGQPKLDKNGNEQAELSVTLQTDLRNWEGAKKPGKDEHGNDLPADKDTGLRRVYFRYSPLRKLGKAVREAGSDLPAFFAGTGNGSALWVRRIANDGRMVDVEVKYKPGTKLAESDPFSEPMSQPSSAPAPAADTSSSPFEAPAGADDEPPF